MEIISNIWEKVESGEIWKIGSLVLLVMVVSIKTVWALIFGEQCPECMEKNAMNLTGNKKMRVFFQSDLNELQCKYCGHCIWNTKSSGGVGGNGETGADNKSG